MSHRKRRKYGNDFVFAQAETGSLVSSARQRQDPYSALPSRYSALSLFVIISNLVVYVLFNVQQGHLTESPASDQLMRFGGNLGPATVGGDLWRLLTSNFVHGGLVHMFANMAAIWAVGRFIHYYFGRLGFLLIFAVSAVFANFAHVVWNFGEVFVGASGAVYGMLGALLAVHLFVEESQRRRLPHWALICIAFFLFDSISRGIVGVQNHNAVHAAGLIVGFVCGGFLAQFNRKDPLALAALSGITVATLFLITAMMLPRLSVYSAEGMETFIIKAEIVKVADQIKKYDHVNAELVTRIERVRSGAIAEDHVLNWIRDDALPRIRGLNANLRGMPLKNEVTRNTRMAYTDLLIAFEYQLKTAVEPKNRNNPRAVAEVGVSVKVAEERARKAADQMRSKMAAL